LTAGADGEGAALALLAIAEELDLAGIDGAGLLELPAAANGRGLREAGVLPNAGPGLTDPPAQGRDAAGIAAGLAEGELSALYLLGCDPLRELPDRELWLRALEAAGTVIAHTAFPTETIAQYADVVFPAEVYPEKEGTLVHPDGRLQRLRPAIAHAGEVQAGWRVLAELALALGLELDLDLLSGASASRMLFEAVPHYAGLTLEEIGGRGVRWQERQQAAAYPAARVDSSSLPRPAAPEPELGAELEGRRSIWDAPEVEFSPALSFLFGQRELV
jgi:NADH-quinone oxidoreductase subunit G